MISTLPVLGGGLGVAGAIWLAGRALAPAIAPSLSFGIGAAVLSYAVFGLMLLRQASLPALLILLVVATVAGLRTRPNLIPARPATFFLAVCLPFAGWYLVHTLAPEIQTDPNAYHLLPALDSMRYGGFSGSITFYDRLPQGIEMLFVPAWRIGGSSAAKLVHCAFFIATLPLIVRLSKLMDLPEHVGYGAAALYFCTPIVGVAGTAAFNDAALVYMTLASVVLAMEDRPVLAGVTAGFCYAVKMTGGLAVPVVLAFFVLRRNWRGAAMVCVAAAAAASPWLLRNWVQTGNPTAPFLNAWFPNPFFYVQTERQLTGALQDYGLPFWQRFTEVLAGDKLGGIVGPAFVVAPVALLALRRKGGAMLVVLALVFSAAWWMNAGSRFLMPALPFLALAICLALPPRLMFAFVAIHALLSWPMLIEAYAYRTLQLRGLPWRAALRLESEAAYLHRVSTDARHAEMVEAHTRAGARILDMAGIPAALVDREVMAHWQSAKAVRLVEGLELARPQGKAPLSVLQADFERESVWGIRAIYTADAEAVWNIHLMELRIGNAPIEDHSSWELRASKLRWELPFAFDRSPITRWSTGQSAERGDYVQAEFPHPIQADSVRLWIPSTMYSYIRIEIAVNGAWRKVETRLTAAPELNLRPAAVQALKREGITHIVAPASEQGIGVLADTLMNTANEWGLDAVASVGPVYLLKVR